MDVGSIGAVGGGFGTGLLIASFWFGFRHGIDWDHIAAITDITSSQEDRRRGVVFGTVYVVGHAIVVFAIGVVAIVLGEQLPAGVDEFMGRVVGVTLIVLGVYVFVSLVRHGRDFRMRSRWMLVFTGVRNLYRRVRPPAARASSGSPHDHGEQPVHVHADGDAAVAVAERIPASQWHHGHHGWPGHHHHKHPEQDDPVRYGRGTAFLVGMLHGVGAETPTQVVIFTAAAGAGGATAGVAVLAAFLVGLMVSNSVITVGSTFGFLQATRNFTVYAAVAVLAGAFSLVIGVLFVVGRESVLPAFFSV